MNKSINHQLIEIYYFVDEFSKHYPEVARWRASNNCAPKFSDAEVITIALMQGYFGCATLSQTDDLVRANASSAFPHLSGYKQWIAHFESDAGAAGLGQPSPPGRRTQAVSEGEQAHPGLSSVAARSGAAAARSRSLLQQQHEGLVLWLPAARPCQPTRTDGRGNSDPGQHRRPRCGARSGRGDRRRLAPGRLGIPRGRGARLVA